MTKPDAAARAAALYERTQKAMREVTENPEIAKGTVGRIVLDMIGSGEDVSTGSIVAALEAILSGAENRAGINELLAKGALKVISDLRS
jgi:predicted PhzF superfamily epimerase YddE/YHI9